jgi:ketosteroid isomerase-like protein
MSKLWSWALIASLLLIAPRSVVGDAAAPDSADTAELTRLAGLAGSAYAARDLDMLDRITADDYVQIDVRGGMLKRAEWLEFVKNRKSELTVITDDVKVRFYGQAAVVTGHWIYTKKENATNVVTESRWTSVWARSPLEWKRHAFQNTYVNADADRCMPATTKSTDPEPRDH